MRASHMWCRHVRNESARQLYKRRHKKCSHTHTDTYTRTQRTCRMTNRQWAPDDDPRQPEIIMFTPASGLAPELGAPRVILSRHCGFVMGWRKSMASCRRRRRRSQETVEQEREKTEQVRVRWCSNEENPSADRRNATQREALLLRSRGVVHCILSGFYCAVCSGTCRVLLRGD